MGARHRHDVFVVRQMAQHLRPFLQREASLAEKTHLRMVVRHGGGVHRHRRGGVAECRGDMLRAVVVCHCRALARKGFGQRRRRAVVTRHRHAFVQKITRQRAHAYASDSEEIYVLVCHFFYCFIL